MSGEQGKASCVSLKMNKPQVFQFCGIISCVFMILPIIFYWDDVGTTRFYLDTAFIKVQATHCQPTLNQIQEHQNSKVPTGERISSSTATVIQDNLEFKFLENTEGYQGEKSYPKINQTFNEISRAPFEEKVQGYELGITSGKTSTELEWIQNERKQNIKDACTDSSITFSGKNRKFDVIPNKELDHLVVDDRHGIIYCYVPKVACSNWKRIMIILSESVLKQSIPYHDPLEIPKVLVHSSNSHSTFSKFWKRYGKFSKQLMKIRLKKYTKFLFVRDPFVRLISAFRNKFAVQNNYFYSQYARQMLKLYANCSDPPETVKEAFSAGIKPTFKNFIQYLLDPQTEKRNPFNEHWKQIYRLCHPCQINYDFIGKLESLDEDASYLLKLLNVEKLVRFPPGSQNQTVVSWERDWFAKIPVAWRRKLYEIYKPDFTLFGYPEPTNLLLD